MPHTLVWNHCDALRMRTQFGRGHLTRFNASRHVRRGIFRYICHCMRDDRICMWRQFLSFSDFPRKRLGNNQTLCIVRRVFWLKCKQMIPLLYTVSQIDVTRFISNKQSHRRF